jgi:hypothetical protein
MSDKQLDPMKRSTPDLPLKLNLDQIGVLFDCLR